MKTQLIDYILSALVLSLLCCLTYGVVALVIDPWVRTIVGPYFVIANSLIALLVFGLFAALTARLVLRWRPMVPGTVAMDDPHFTHWKLFTVLHEFGRGALLPFTTVFARPVVAKLFGAKIGKDIALGGKLVDPELIHIGDEAIIGQDSILTAHAIVSGKILFAQVVVEARATVGVNVVVMPGVRIGEGSVIAAGAVVAPHTVIPSGEFWGGIPAKKIKQIEAVS